jgi:hypothetical protein
MCGVLPPLPLRPRGVVLKHGAKFTFMFLLSLLNRSYKVKLEDGYEWWIICVYIYIYIYILRFSVNTLI